MYVCMVNRVRLPILLVVSWTEKINFSLSTFAPEKLVARALPSLVILLISTLRLNPVRTYGIPPEFHGGVHLFILNRHTPSVQSPVYRVTHGMLKVPTTRVYRFTLTKLSVIYDFPILLFYKYFIV